MSVKIVIEKEFNNPLLNRKQLYFKVIHQQQVTPTRNDIRKKLAAQFNSDLDTVIISKLTPKYGQAFTVGYAKIYETAEKAQQIEPKYVLKRNQGEKAKKKEE